MTQSASRKLNTPMAPPRPVPPSPRLPLHSETRPKGNVDDDAEWIDVDLDVGTDDGTDDGTGGIDLDGRTATHWPPPRPTAPPSVGVRPGVPKRLSPPAIVRPLPGPPPSFSIVVLDSSKPIEDSLSVDELPVPDLATVRRSRTGKVVAGVTLAAVAVLGAAELVLTFG